MSLVTVHGPNTMYDNEEHMGIPGTPGTFRGGSAQVDPADIAELRAEVGANPNTPWINGQYVVLVDTSHAYWDGNSWEVGQAPNFTSQPEINGVSHALSNGNTVWWNGTGWTYGVAPEAEAVTGKPGSFTPAGYVPADLAHLASDVNAPAARWVNGEFVHLGDNSEAYFDGTNWVGGEGVSAPGDPITGVVAGIPGNWVNGVIPVYSDLKPANITAARAHAVVGDTAWAGHPTWTTGQYVIVGASTHIHWNGTTWTSGDKA
jgi:hypothetical protein